MGLVDYAASSGSESDEPDPTSSSMILKNEESGTIQQSLFMGLPPPVKNATIIEEQIDEFLNKKAEVIEKPPKRIRINVPELISFNDVIDTEHVPTKEKKKKCGLFSILPTPKTVPLKNTCFVPNSLQKNSKSTALSSKKHEEPKPHVERIAPSLRKTKVRRASISDSESETEESACVPSFVCDDNTWNELFVKKKRLAVTKTKKSVVQQVDQGVIDLAPEAEKPYVGLDNLAFKELVGNRKKEKSINVVEIEEDQIHPDREEWLKSLTDPNFEASPEIKAPVNRTSLVKNHITSLAERALANDKDLQIRWAESRHSRNQTRTKYGF